MNSLIITIPLPPKEVRNNWRGHYMTKARAVKRYRHISCLAAKSAMGGQVLGWARASVHITMYFPTARHLDPTNCIDSLKAAFDGLEDAGVIVNDNNLWPERPVILTKQTNPRVELRITKEEP